MLDVFLPAHIPLSDRQTGYKYIPLYLLNMANLPEGTEAERQSQIDKNPNPSAGDYHNAKPVEYRYTEQPANPSVGIEHFLPTVIPALQSGSYILVLVFAYIAFSSRKYVTQFLKTHLELVERLKEDVDKQTEAAGKHVAILEQLHDNYKQLNQIIDLRLQAYLQKFEDTVKRAMDDHEETKH